MTELLAKKEQNRIASLSLASNLAPEELLKKAVEEKLPIYTSYGLAKKDIEALYITIHNLYERGKYQEALPLFALMAFYAPQDKRGWMGIASCYELLSQPAAALINYRQASELDPTDPVIHFRMANCWLMTKKQQQALDSLHECIRLSEDKKEYASLQENALHLQEALESSPK